MPLIGTNKVSIVTAETDFYPVPREESVVFATTDLEAVPVNASASYYNWFIFKHVGGWEWEYESDIIYNQATGETIFWRVTGYEYSNNYTTFTLHIRHGVHWNDGVPYTSADYVFSMAMLKQYPALFGGDVVRKYVTSVTAPDNYTVVFQLNSPLAIFHRLFSTPGAWTWFNVVVPEHIWKNVDPTTFKNNPPVETGPFRLYGSYPQQRYNVWVRDDNYWAKDVLGVFPANKYAIQYVLGSTDQSIADWINGRIDMNSPSDFGWQATKTVMAIDKQTMIVNFPGGCTVGIRSFNCRRYPLDIPAVRWAISNCINSEKLAAIYPLANSTTPSEIPWGMSTFPYLAKYFTAGREVLAQVEADTGFKWGYDPQKAAETFDNLLFTDRNGDGIRETPNGTQLAWEIACIPTNPESYNIAVDLASELNKIGCKVTLREVTNPMIDQLGFTGDFDIIMASSQCVGWPMEMFSGWSSSNYVPPGNRSTTNNGWSYEIPYPFDTTLDTLIARLNSEDPDSSQAFETWKQCLYVWMKYLFIAPAYDTQLSNLFSTKYWTGWPTDTNMYIQPYAWWGPTQALIIWPRLQSTQAPMTYTTVWFIAAVPQFTGVDEITYGPYVSGESFSIPKSDAVRLITDEKATYTPPVPPGLLDTVNSIYTKQTSLETAITALTNKVNAIPTTPVDITSLTTLLYGIIGLQAIVLIVVIILMIRKK